MGRRADGEWTGMTEPAGTWPSGGQPGGGQPGGAEAAGPGRSGRGQPGKGRTQRKSAAGPRWARLCTIFGAVLLVLSGVTLGGFQVALARFEGAVPKEDLFGDEAAGTQQKVSDIKGPLNILLVGIDPRKPETPPLADSVMVVHVNEALDSAYVFSMPRDLLVDIPRFSKADYLGGRGKLNSAMANGSRVSGKNPSAAQGFELLAKTVSKVTGIERFDAGAIINFSGFVKIVDAMGGVTMYIDQNVKSEHRRPDGSHRTLRPGGGGYVGPQAEYKKGTHHLKGWQALDYVRQRYGLPKGDYDRQRHQRQFIQAMVDQALSKDVVTNPIKLGKVVDAAGQSLSFNGRGHKLVDFAFALRNLRADSIQMIQLPGGGVTENGKYQGEAFEPIADEFFGALKEGTVDAFVMAHPELLNKAT